MREWGARPGSSLHWPWAEDTQVGWVELDGAKALECGLGSAPGPQSCLSACAVRYTHGPGGEQAWHWL